MELNCPIIKASTSTKILNEERSDCMRNYITVGIFLSILVLILNENPWVGLALIPALLSVIAVGLLSLIWKEKTKNFSIRPVIVTSIFVFIVVFFLSGELIVPMTGISLAFIVVGLFGLLIKS